MDKPKSIITNKKLCNVCGDKAFCFNFSGLSCESCKAFFRRAAFKNDLKCKNGNNCEINRITRTNCKKCRFEKCVAIGMKKDLVLVSKRIHPSKPNPTVMPIETMCLLSNERSLNLKMHELSRLGDLHKAALAFPNESSWQIVGQVDNVSQLVNISAANIKPTIRFCKKVTEFNWLTKDEQVIALKCFVPEIDLIRVAFLYNTQTNGWAALEHSECDKRAVFVKMDFLKSWSNAKKAQLFSNFIVDLHLEMENDPAIRDLLLVQLVFKHRPKMANLEFMRYHNAVFHYLLHRYLEHKYLDTNRAAQKYTKLMGLLIKMDTIAIGIRGFFANQHIATQVAPVIREIYNLGQTLQ